MAQSAETANAATEFVFSRFGASCEDVWNAFTQPEPLKRWWGTPASSIEIARHELKPGRLSHYWIRFPDGRAMWARFIFRQIVAPGRLVWLYGFSDEHAGLTLNPCMRSLPLETLLSRSPRFNRNVLRTWTMFGWTLSLACSHSKS